MIITKSISRFASNTIDTLEYERELRNSQDKEWEPYEKFFKTIFILIL